MEDTPKYEVECSGCRDKDKRIQELEEALSKIRKILYHSDSPDALIENEKYLYEIAEEALRTP